MLKDEVFEDCQIVFRNFSGKEGPYNRAGDRNFGVVVERDRALRMEKEGWNIKWFKETDETPNPDGFIPVSVSYKGRPPKVVMINSAGRTLLEESTIESLDWIDIKEVDLILHPYEWAINAKSGVKAYLKSLFVTIDEDELDLKYSQI